MSEHQISLTTSDGQQLNFTCDSEMDIVTAAERIGTVLPSVCRGGCCGLCYAHCLTGEYRLGSVNASVLSAEAIAKRDVLLCKTFPQSNLQINAPFAYNQIDFGIKKARTAIITALKTIAERTVQLTLHWQDLDLNAAVEFKPGQYVELTIPDTDIRRAYSMSNTSNWQGELEFLIRLQANGQFSSYLRDSAKLGDQLLVTAPKGQFGFHGERLTTAIFIAGGTGIAPFLSILREMAEFDENRPVLLFFGVNNDAESFLQQELADLQNQLPDLQVTLCVWQVSENSLAFHGTPADALKLHLENHPGDYDIYLCGPPLLVDAINKIAIAAGINEQQIFVEKFA